MDLNNANLQTLNRGFKATFRSAFAGVTPQWNRVALQVSSTTKEEEYAWLGQLPRIREWIGERVHQQIAHHGYKIRNKKFESTIDVEVDDISDDQYGVYTPLFAEMGHSVAVFPDELVYGLLATGFTTACYDGQYFFDTDHPVLDANGAPQSVSNSGGGGGAGWFLLDVSRPIKPLLYQEREKFDLVIKDDPKSENVFEKDQLVYGTKGRCNVGFGLWQLAYGSKQTLDSSSYATARAALMGMKGDYGRPLGINPRLLVCGPSNEGAARRVLTSDLGTGGVTNEWKGTAEILVVPWLT